MSAIHFLASVSSPATVVNTYMPHRITKKILSLYVASYSVYLSNDYLQEYVLFSPFSAQGHPLAHLWSPKWSVWCAIM